MQLIDSVAFLLFQSKTLSLNPAKKAALILRRPFGSETAESISIQPEPVTTTVIHENNDTDMPVKFDEPSASVVTSIEDEVQCYCYVFHSLSGKLCLCVILM